MERYITDSEGRRTAIVLDIEEYEALVEAAEDAHVVDGLRKSIARGQEEMIPYHEAREKMLHNRASQGSQFTGG